jgi:predicted RNA-binding protein
LHELLGLKVNINKYDPLKIGYSTFVSVPNCIKKKHAVINVCNEDEYCFLWAVVSALYPANKNAKRKSSYPHFKDVLTYDDDLQFPITIKDVRKFEKLNKLIINLYCIENKKVLPCSLSSNVERNAKARFIVPYTYSIT